MTLKDQNCSIKESIRENRADPSKRAKPFKPTDKLVILSQDCDINGQESTVEVAVLSIPKGGDRTSSRISKVRDVKKLRIKHGDDHYVLHVSLIGVLSKVELLECLDKFHIEHLDEENLSILKKWRVNRYSRAALPHKFNTDFIQARLAPEDSGLRQTLEANHKHVLGLYAYVFPLDEDAPRYYVSVSIVLSLKAKEETGVSAFHDALMGVLKQVHKESDHLHMLQVEDVEFGQSRLPTRDLVVPPEDFTAEDQILMSELTLDYMCWPDAD
ncbi:hypothetical protein [uncultured Pseudoteredinibacter sp.]|uniref:hypothetical protein n=1 Tax=uncultured Pseudoteredinibacter sp. TaxID=1641701 RepID=UPI002621DEA7|nr:hypothetical protein [uncultured Pseudoteredinibacter sp.]